jgi:hypothetical protein
MAALAAIAGVTGWSSVAHAVFVWDDGGSPDHSWNTAANWNPDGVPAAADTAQWSTPATVDIPAGGAAANDLQVSNVTTTFNLNNFALAVGPGTSRPDGNSANMVFNGPGTVTFSGPLTVGENQPFSPPSGHARVTAQNGATVNTTNMVLGKYRGAAIVTATGAGTVWNDNGNTNFGGTTAPGYTYTAPRVQMFVTNGAHYNFNLGTYATRNSHVLVISAGSTAVNESRIVVDGAGSQFNLTSGYGSNFHVGGYGANSNWEITNGGVLNATGSNLGLSFANGTSTNTYTISGAGSKMTASQFGVALRSSDSAAARGTTVVNVLTGGTFESSDADGSNRGITIGDRGRVSLQGGTISVPAGKDVVLRDTGASSGLPGTLEGSGTIIGGNLRVEGNSIVSPGISSTGLMTIQDGNLTATAVTSPFAQFTYDLSTTNGAHDRISLVTPTKAATIPGVFTYSNLGAGNGFTGTMDFLLADTISYSGFASGDIPLNTDNLDTLLSSAGYTTRVTGTSPTNPGQYRYFIAPDVSGTSDALRLQLVAIPEPGSVAAVAALGCSLLTRRRGRGRRRCDVG